MADNKVRTDLIGRELAVGNAVAFSTSGHWLMVGCIRAFTPKMVRIEYKVGNRIEAVLRYSNDLALLEGPALIEYQLKKG